MVTEENMKTSPRTRSLMAATMDGARDGARVGTVAVERGRADKVVAGQDGAFLMAWDWMEA